MTYMTEARRMIQASAREFSMKEVLPVANELDKVKGDIPMSLREGVKLASYRVLADALTRVRDLRFALTIVGDGPARADVERAFATLADRVTFAGARSNDDVAALLRTHDVFVWPAIGEAIGIAFLEAQACGLPVIAGATPGVAAIIAPGRSGSLVPAGDAAAFADALRQLIVDAR